MLWKHSNFFCSRAEKSGRRSWTTCKESWIARLHKWLFGFKEIVGSVHEALIAFIPVGFDRPQQVWQPFYGTDSAFFPADRLVIRFKASRYAIRSQASAFRIHWRGRNCKNGSEVQGLNKFLWYSILESVSTLTSNDLLRGFREDLSDLDKCLFPREGRSRFCNASHFLYSGSKYRLMKKILNSKGEMLMKREALLSDQTSDLQVAVASSYENCSLPFSAAKWMWPKFGVTQPRYASKVQFIRKPRVREET